MLNIMKTKITSIIFITHSLSMSIFFVGCSKTETPCNKKTENFTLNSDDKSKVPYLGNDTLIFINVNNDTMKCVGAGKIVGQDCIDGGGSPDCPTFTKTNCYENNKLSFLDSDKNLFINFELTYSKDILDYNGKSWKYNFLININDIKFYGYASQISTKGTSNYLSKITLNGVSYDDVSFIYRNISDTTSKIYYNKNQGLIRIEINNQQIIWNLKN